MVCYIYPVKRQTIVILHLAFWGFLVAKDTFYGIMFSHAPLSSIPRSFIMTIGYYLVSATCFYAAYWGVGPTLFIRKRYIAATIMSFLALALTVFTRYAVEFWFMKPVMHFDNYRGEAVSWQYFVLNVFYYYFPSYFNYGLIYFFVENWYLNTRRRQLLEKEKMAIEMAFLRSQVNPHFLFNTLNDIYALVYQQSPQAPEAVLKLSDLLRYMLEDSETTFVPLKREIEYLQNLIALQRIGSNGRSCIDFRQEGYFGDQMIAPFLFIAFVENAFKHGVLNLPDQPVAIQVTASPNTIHLKVWNLKSKLLKDVTGGIGLKNVLRRLDVIYPKMYILVIDDTKDYYSVNLQLNLTNENQVSRHR